MRYNPITVLTPPSCFLAAMGIAKLKPPAVPQPFGASNPCYTAENKDKAVAQHSRRLAYLSGWCYLFTITKRAIRCRCSSESKRRRATGKCELAAFPAGIHRYISCTYQMRPMLNEHLERDKPLSGSRP